MHFATIRTGPGPLCDIESSRQHRPQLQEIACLAVKDSVPSSDMDEPLERLATISGGTIHQK
jgi:hypothetical protein